MRTHITNMGTNHVHVFQNVFLSQLSMEFVTKENDETTIGFIHLEWYKCINPIVVSSFSLVTNSIDNCDKKTFWNTCT